MKLNLARPLKEWKVTQKFGNKNPMYNDTGGAHNGLDLRAPDGTPVYASHDGRVTFAGYDGGGGLGVVIRTEKEYFFDDEKQEFISEEEAFKRGYKEV